MEPDERPLRPADARKLRRFLTGQTRLRDVITAPYGLPFTITDERVLLRCAVEARLQHDGRLLAAVAPWLLTARLRTRAAFSSADGVTVIASPS